MKSLTISHEELFQLLNMMKPFVKNYPKQKAKNLMLEVSIEKDKLLMSIPNCTMNAKCETTGIGKFSIQFLYFYEIIKMTTTPMITIDIDEAKLVIGQTSFKIRA